MERDNKLCSKCRAFACAELHADVAQAASSSTSDALKTFLSGLQFEAKKGFQNLQVYAPVQREHATSPGQSQYLLSNDCMS